MQKRKVYLDNGATTKADDVVVEAMRAYFNIDYGNASSLHEFGRSARKGLEKAREEIAKTINAEPEEVIFTSGGTESDNIAVQQAAHANCEPGNHIITTCIEHHAVEETCKFLEKQGSSVTWLSVDKEGFINLRQLEKAITPKTVLVSIIHANNEIGTIQDIKAIGEVCKRHKVCFHTDAVQSYTKVPIDVKSMNVDLISVSGHKIHGPKGIGALYVKKGTKITSLMKGGSHEFCLRPGTENVAGAVGFAKAAMLCRPEDTARMEKNRDYMIERILKEIPHTRLNGPMENRLCNNINISFEYIEGESLLMKLDDEGIAVSTGSACSSRSLEPSHVLLAIGLKHETAHGSIRFTISRYTTKQEIGYAIGKLKTAVKELRQMSPLYKGD